MPKELLSQIIHFLYKFSLKIFHVNKKVATPDEFLETVLNNKKVLLEAGNYRIKNWYFRSRKNRRVCACTLFQTSKAFLTSSHNIY